MKKILKPWGYEEILEKNKFYVLKKLFMKKNKRCSLQFHKKKIETIFVISGSLYVFYGKLKKLKKKLLKKNQVITLKPYTIHRMLAKSDCFYLESSTTQLKDVVRLEDDYNRI